MSASSLSNTGSPRPTGTRDAIEVDARADRVAGRAQLVEKHLELRELRGIGAEERILVDLIEIERRAA